MGKRLTLPMTEKTVRFYEDHFMSLTAGVNHALIVMPDLLDEASTVFKEATKSHPGAFRSQLGAALAPGSDPFWKDALLSLRSLLDENALLKVESLSGATIELAQIGSLLKSKTSNWPGEAKKHPRHPVKLPEDVRHFYQRLFGTKEGRACAFFVEAFARWGVAYQEDIVFQGSMIRRSIDENIWSLATRFLSGREISPYVPAGSTLVTITQALKGVPEGLKNLDRFPLSFLTLLEVIGSKQGRKHVVISPRMHERVLEDLAGITGESEYRGVSLACEVFVSLAEQEMSDGTYLQDLSGIEVEFIRAAMLRSSKTTKGSVVGRPLIHRLQRFCRNNNGPIANKVLKSGLLKRLGKKTPLQLALLEIHCRTNKEKLIA